MFIRNLRLALRLLRRSPGFASAAVLTLALGIGANVAVFSVVDAVLLQPLPYVQPDRLVRIFESTGSRRPGDPALSDLTAYQSAQSFSGVAGYDRTSLILTGQGEPVELRGETVTWNLFDLLGTSPALGRVFVADDGRPGREHEIVLTNDLWRATFAADPRVVGRTIALSGEPYVIVGVMPPGFEGLSHLGSGFSIQFFVPAVIPSVPPPSRAARYFGVVARLKPGVSIEQARAELERISADLAGRFPDTNRDVAASAAFLSEDVVRDVRVSLLIMLGAVALVLLVASINLVNLLVVRALSQRRETAIRLAIGATARQVLSDFAVRGLVLGAMGGALGLLIGSWVRDALVSLAPPTLLTLPGLEHLGLSAHIVFATIALSVTTGLVAGLLPVLQIGRADAAPTLKSTALSTSGTRSIARWRGVLMAAEVAAAVTLAIGAGLLLRSFVRWSDVDLGFRTDHVLDVTVRPPASRYPDQAARARFFEAVEQRVRSVPGVEAVGVADVFPMRGGGQDRLRIDGDSSAMSRVADAQPVSPGYFDVLKIPLVRGRLLAAGDRSGAPPVAVVSQAFVRDFLGGADPIGRRFRFEDSQTSIAIVGVTADVRREGPQRAPAAEVYLSAAQPEVYDARLWEIAVRTNGNPYAFAGALRRAVASVDADQPITNIFSLDDILMGLTSRRRFNLVLLGALALLACGLAVVGVYGVIAQAAVQRLREIGVRIALGATRADIVSLVVMGGLRWTLAGVALGLAAAMGTARVMSGLLFDVSAFDGATFAAAAAVMIGTACLASYLPARRAASVDPLIVLRGE